jgi:hypothetical protein
MFANVGIRYDRATPGELELRALPAELIEQARSDFNRVTATAKLDGNDAHEPRIKSGAELRNKKALTILFVRAVNWLRGLNLNQRPSGYEPELFNNYSHISLIIFLFLIFVFVVVFVFCKLAVRDGS